MSEELHSYLNTVIGDSVSAVEEGEGGRDLVYNSRACIVFSLLVGCVFPSGVIGVRGVAWATPRTPMRLSMFTARYELTIYV